MSNETTAGPYRADWDNGMCVVRNLNAPEGNRIMMMWLEDMQWFVDNMNAAFAAGQASREQQWIPVSDGLPVYGQKVIACHAPSRGVFPATLWMRSGRYGNRTYNEWMDDNDGIRDVTHYMPLPSPPNSTNP
jgi:hypothetical protein